MADFGQFAQLLEQRLPFLQTVEESLVGRGPVFTTALWEVVDETMTTPRSLQHVGEHIVEIAKANWITVAGLNTVVAYLGELVELWETMLARHREAALVFSNANERPYCLFLRSFSGVAHPIEVPGARAVMYLNEPELDANVAAMLMESASWLNPVSCMHTDDLALLARSGRAMPSFRVQTVTWKGILSDAIASSGMIIFYLDGSSPGVSFELDRIREHGMTSRTVIVYRGDSAPDLDHADEFAAVMSVRDFIDSVDGATGPGTLSVRGEEVLRLAAAVAVTLIPPTERLVSLSCEIVETGAPADLADEVDPATSFFITEENSSAWVSYVANLPDSFIRWNAVSQDIRLRGIQPSADDFNALYRNLRMAFVASACLGHTNSIACMVGLLAKVASMAKLDESENAERLDRYMTILDMARRLNALTGLEAWAEKLEAFRQSILEDPYF